MKESQFVIGSVFISIATLLASPVTAAGDVTLVDGQYDCGGGYTYAGRGRGRGERVVLALQSPLARADHDAPAGDDARQDRGIDALPRLRE